MKYRISYTKLARKYDFAVTFQTESYRDKKLIQYKKGSTNFKLRKL